MEPVAISLTLTEDEWRRVIRLLLEIKHPQVAFSKDLTEMAFEATAKQSAAAYVIAQSYLAGNGALEELLIEERQRGSR
jgi:hypothetical protein